MLRRLIRRAVLKGDRVLGIGEVFLWRLYEGIAEALGGVYDELVSRREVIVETLKNEEELFRGTLAKGIGELSHYLKLARRTPQAGTMPGPLAFQLYDTYGFPLEVTQELCAEAGIEVDVDGFYEALKEAQERSRAARGNATVYGGVVVRFDLSVLSGQQDDAKPTPTRFVGYEVTETHATIVGACPVEGGQIAVALDQTPFYAESGGEVSDTGVIEGEGFKQAMQVLDGGRISIAALSVGIAQGAYEAAVRYAKERQQFGRPIADFQAIQFKLADMATQIECARLLTLKAATLKDAKKPVTQASAMAKLFASETAVRVSEESVQIHGGYGYTKDYPAEKYWRDSKLCTIGEGTSEIQRIVIAKNLLRA